LSRLKRADRNALAVLTARLALPKNPKIMKAAAVDAVAAKATKTNKLKEPRYLKLRLFCVKIVNNKYKGDF